MPPAGFEPGAPGNVRIWQAADLITIRRFMGSGPIGQKNVGSFCRNFFIFQTIRHIAYNMTNRSMIRIHLPELSGPFAIS